MTEEEELDAASRALAAAENNPWTPECIAAAFLDDALELGQGITLAQLTVIGWLRLERARSPFLTGHWPDAPEQRMQALCFGIAQLSGPMLTPIMLMSTFTGAEAAALESKITHWVNASFRTALPMHFPESKAPLRSDHGFGWWVRLVVKLICEIKMRPADAFACPLSQAFALVATRAAIEGAEPKEMNYREREAMDAVDQEVARG